MTEDTENRASVPGGECDGTCQENTAPADSTAGQEESAAQEPAADDNPDVNGRCGDDEEPCACEGEETDGEKEESEGSGEPCSGETAAAGDEASALAEENGKLKKDIEALDGQLKKQQEIHIRTVAEYDNYRKRTEREKMSVYADATAAAVKEILTVEDNLARALEQKECTAEDMRKGVEMVEKQMRKALEKLGVTEMGRKGDKFDPALHNAVSHIEDEDIEENTIAEVFQKGYMLGGKVVRHAMVQVAN